MTKSGEMNITMDKSGKTIVIKVGTSTLTYENGKVNIRRIEKLSRVICDLQNAGNQVVLVSSGAIGVGVGKLGLRVDSRANPRSKFYCQLPFTEQLLSKPVEVSEL